VPPRPLSYFAEPNEQMATVVLAPTGTRRTQRWADVAGNEYATEWAGQFSYEAADVRVTYLTRGEALEGAIVARGLKPNFAYQLKLVGDRSDIRSFERIGQLGRWQIDPERARRTNFKDGEYQRRKGVAGLEIEAYILFDYFVTDSHGAAAQSFLLDSTYHVLWSMNLNDRPLGPRRKDSRLFEHVVVPSGAAYPPDGSTDRTTVAMWLEHEWVNPRPLEGQVRLPPGRYKGGIQLTEETFHLTKKGGWARVMHAPVEFEIVAQQDAHGTSRQGAGE
jgi:hypothetical protein